MKFAQKTSRQDVVEAYGFDWYKIVKVDGGYMLFESQQEYKAWKNQK